MDNLWSVLAQTLALSVAAAVLLAAKRLFLDKLSPRWQYGVWAVLLLFAAVWLMQRFNWVVTPELIRDSILLKFFAENNPIGLIAAL